MDVVFACTGNICRSPMAEVLLGHRLAERAPEVRVASVGRLFDGEPAHEHAVSAMADRGLDLGPFRSRIQDLGNVGEASLILAMENRHVRDLSLLGPGIWNRTFTLKEFARTVQEAGPRPAGTPLREWVIALGTDRNPTRHLGDDRTEAIEDPLGSGRRRFRSCAREIDDLLDTIVEHTWTTPPHLSSDDDT